MIEIIFAALIGTVPFTNGLSDNSLDFLSISRSIISLKTKPKMLNGIPMRNKKRKCQISSDPVALKAPKTAMVDIPMAFNLISLAYSLIVPSPIYFPRLIINKNF
jgi:hypothetical protein